MGKGRCVLLITVLASTALAGSKSGGYMGRMRWAPSAPAVIASYETKLVWSFLAAVPKYSGIEFCPPPPAQWPTPRPR